MSLKDCLDPRCVSLALVGQTKDAIIREMVDLLDRAGKLPDPKAALQAILDREAKMSTGMQNGVAIPHGKTASVSELVAAVALRREAVDFDALDGKPCSIFIMTLSPVDRTGPHIQFLAEVSRVLSDAGSRARLLAAGTAADVLRVLQADTP